MKGERQRWATPWLVAAIIVGLVIKIYFVTLGPEPDPDAYGHAMAGRRVLSGDPGVDMHWVWLPLWHWVHAGASRWGGGIDSVRALNLALTSIAPLLLSYTLSRAPLINASPERRAIAPLAGSILALAPACLSQGATSQLEPPVMTLVLAACALTEGLRGRADLSRWRSVAIGVTLSLAALIRYEAWVLPQVWLALTFRTPSRWRAAPCWVLPALTVAAWCVYHHQQTGEWLQFLRHNRGFAEGYLAHVGYPWGRGPNAFFASVWYVTLVPFAEYRWLVPFGAVGVWSILRHGPRSLAASGCAVIAFLSYGFVMQQHLGLARHALTIAPLYAACVAAGVVVIGRALERLVPRARLASYALVVAFVTAFVLSRVVPSMLADTSWRTRAYVSANVIARALRDRARSGDHVFCSEAAVEVLSNVPAEDVTRRSMRDVSAADLEAASKPGAQTWIVAERAEAEHLAPFVNEIAEAGGLVLLRRVD